MKVIQGNGQDVSNFIETQDIRTYLESHGAILLSGFHSQIEIDELSRKMGFIPATTYIPGIGNY